MSKYKIDAGLDYLKEIGFERIRGKYGLADRFIKLFGKTKADQIYEKRVSLPDGSIEFYEFKNSDPLISKAFTEAYDGDILRKACNYVDAHRAFFGATILEVGCESGYMTGFLAKAFPDSKIVSIDRSPAALNMAMARIESLGYKNVEFRNASLNEITEKYDTVFSMRTIHENLAKDETPFIGEPLLEQFNRYNELTREYTRHLISCLTEKGNLCFFERVGHDPLLCGWMCGLCLEKCAPDLDTYEEVICEEVGEKSTFQAFVCHNKSECDPNVVIDFWSNTYEIDISNEGRMTGFDALAYLWEHADNLIRGVRVLDSNNIQCGRFALFNAKPDEHMLLFLVATGRDPNLLQGCALEDKENVLNDIQRLIDINIRAGFHIEEIDHSEDSLEGNNTLKLTC